MNPQPAAPGYTGRFAPSPTGPLHPGSLLAALGSWLLARRAGGRWLVRIEDLDPPREIAGASEAQLQALAGFGLVSDGPIVRQSERGGRYAQALQRLLDSGAAFTCHCSRADLALEGGIHHQCRAGARRPDPAVRFRVAPGTEVDFDDAVHGRVHQDVWRDVGDFVLRRADGFWAYQLAVVVDDAAQGITHVARGADLLDSTARQILLQRALVLPTPAYAHLPLLRDEQGRKLSKSLASQPVDPRDPLPALRATWSALGQPAVAVAAAVDVAAFLDVAREHFEPARIPATPIDASYRRR